MDKLMFTRLLGNELCAHHIWLCCSVFVRKIPQVLMKCPQVFLSLV